MPPQFEAEATGRTCVPQLSESMMEKGHRKQIYNHVSYGLKFFHTHYLSSTHDNSKT